MKTEQVIPGTIAATYKLMQPHYPPLNKLGPEKQAVERPESGPLKRCNSVDMSSILGRCIEQF